MEIMRQKVKLRKIAVVDNIENNVKEQKKLCHKKTNKNKIKTIG